MAAVFGKILLSEGFHVYFVGIRSLFLFILLTYNFVIMLHVLMWGTLGIVWTVRFYFIIIQKSEEENSGCNQITCSFNNYRL